MNYIARKLRAFWEDIKAYRRGERRTQPDPIRGRVFEKKAKASLEMKVTRADGTVEYHKAPATVSRR